MNRFFSTLAHLVVRYRYLVVLAWVVVAIVATRALPSMGSEVNNDNSQFLPASAPSEQAANLATPLLGNRSNQSQVIVVASSSSTLTPADQKAIAREVLVLGHVRGVVSAKEAAISPNGKAAEVTLSVSAGQADIPAQKTVLNAISAALANSAAPPGLSLHLAGPVASNVANQESSDKTGGKVQGLSFLFIIVLLLLIFRAPLAALITLLPPGFALVTSMRFIGALGMHGLKISEITELLLIVLLLGAGTDYGLFLVFRVREAVRAGREPREAVAFALSRVGESISASAGTVILALLTLLFATFGIYKDLGLPLALGVAVMLLAGLTLLPALLAIFGKAVFWPGRVHVGDDRRGLWGRVAARLVRRPAITLGIGVVVFLALASAALGYKSSGFGGATSAPAGSSAAIGNAVLAADFPKAAANPANLVMRYKEPVWDDPSVLVLAQTTLARSGQFSHLTGPLDPTGTAMTPAQYATLHARLGPPERLPAVEPAGVGVPTDLYNAYRATAELVAPGGHVVQFEAALKAGAQQTTAAMDATPSVRRVVAQAAARSGAQANGVAGEAAALYDVSSTSNHDLVHIVPIAIVAIAILLALVLRSLVAPLYLVLSVGLSYLAALGLSTLVFVDLGGSGGLTFILPFLMFIFLLALGEDYNILVMTRIREEAHARPLREAVTEAVGRTGPTITSAGLVLAGSFLVLVVASSGPGSAQIRDIGFGLAFGILMDTFFVRTLLVPATVSLLGRWNWWPSRLSAHPARDSSGPKARAAEEPLSSVP